MEDRSIEFFVVVLRSPPSRRPGRSEGYASPGNTDRPPDKDVAPWDHQLGPKGQPVSIVHPESRLTENAKTRKTNDVLDEDGKELTSDMKVKVGVCVLRAPLHLCFVTGSSTNLPTLAQSCPQRPLAERRLLLWQVWSRQA